jgi:chromosome segregation protein
MVNIKLAGDLKESHNESLRLKSLEHRLQAMSQSEAFAKSRIIDLEDALKIKEKEFLEARQKTEEVETLRIDEFEYSLRVAAENLKVSQDKNQELMETIENTQRTYDTTISSLKNEVERLNERLEKLSASTLSADEHTRTLQIEISELQGQLKSSKAEVHLANENAEAQVEAYKKRDKDLTAEITDLRERNKTFQENASAHEEMLMKLRARVDELEDNFVESERLKDAKNNEVQAIEKELLKSKQASKTYLEEITKFQDEKNETERALMRLQYELDDLNAKYADLEGVLYKRTADKLTKAEASIQ